MQERLPRQRRRRHLQSRIPLALLRRPRPPPQRLRLRQHRPLGPPRVERPRPRESNDATPLPPRHRQTRRRNPAPAQHPALRPRNLQRLVLPHRPRTADAFVRTMRSERADVADADRQAPRQQDERRASAPAVLLWADTFNNYFLPATARAAVEVLETAGYRVLVPRANSLLRTPSLRLRHARPRRIPAPQHSRRTRPRDRSRNPRRRTRAQLRRRLPRRTPQPLPPRRARPGPEQTNVPAQRISRTRTRSQLASSRSSSAKPCSTDTAITNPS